MQEPSKTDQEMHIQATEETEYEDNQNMSPVNANKKRDSSQEREREVRNTPQNEQTTTN